jgi:hypothetical protein
MCCLALCLVIGGGAARATLITVDDPTFGPNSLVLDTNTDLEWLNLRFSLGLSGRQVLAQTGPAGRFAGFQYATRDQFVTLFTEVFGTSHLANSTGSLDFNATKNFANLFGPTDGTQQLPTIAGLFDVFMSQGLGPPGFGTGIFFNYTLGGSGLVGTSDTDSFALDSSIFGGSFLVAVPVPVPEPSLPILSVGLLGIAAVMLRRRPRRFNNPAP